MVNASSIFGIIVHATLAKGEKLKFFLGPKPTLIVKFIGG